MKKAYIILLILLLTVIGCDRTNIPNKTPASNAEISSSTTIDAQTTPMNVKSATTESNYPFKDDEYYLVHYIYGLDIAFPELLFQDATQIKPEELFMFFVYIVDFENLFNYEEWFNKKDGKYHIPGSIIEPTLKKYLNITSFNGGSVAGYDKNKNEIVTSMFAGFGGDRQAKLDKKEYLGNNTIKLTATFYRIDDTYSKPLDTKIYVIQVDPNNEREYKYLSVTRER